MVESFRVGITQGMRLPDGSLPVSTYGLELLVEQRGLSCEFLAADPTELTPELIEGYDAILVSDSNTRVTARSLFGLDRLLLVARLGVGYDRIDVAACSEKDVLVSITPDGVRRPMAVAMLTFLLALSHKLLLKDRLTREGRWAEKDSFRGAGLTGRTVGLVGLGNIAREFIRLTAPLDLRYLASDPYVTPQEVSDLPVRLVHLPVLLEGSDFVCVTCPLTTDTFHLLDGERLSVMKPSAYVINVARGPIIDMDALRKALELGEIAGAGIDVFEEEPVSPDDPLLRLGNVIVAPHAIGHTDEIFRGNGASASRAILAVADGRMPEYVVNASLGTSSGLRKKLDRHSLSAGRSGATAGA